MLRALALLALLALTASLVLVVRADDDDDNFDRSSETARGSYQHASHYGNEQQYADHHSGEASSTSDDDDDDDGDNDNHERRATEHTRKRERLGGWKPRNGHKSGSNEELSSDANDGPASPRSHANHGGMDDRAIGGWCAFGLMVIFLCAISIGCLLKNTNWCGKKEVAVSDRGAAGARTSHPASSTHSMSAHSASSHSTSATPEKITLPWVYQDNTVVYKKAAAENDRPTQMRGGVYMTPSNGPSSLTQLCEGHLMRPLTPLDSELPYYTPATPPPTYKSTASLRTSIPQ